MRATGERVVRRRYYYEVVVPIVLLNWCVLDLYGSNVLRHYFVFICSAVMKGCTFS